MIKLVLVRHGQSVWNLENRFTGWTDVPLSDKGIKEAKNAGRLLKNNGYSFLSCRGDKLKEKNKVDFSKVLFCTFKEIFESYPLK